MSKIIQLPGLPPTEPDTQFAARGELAANLYKLYKVMQAQAFVAGELDMPDIQEGLMILAGKIAEQRDAVVGLLIDQDDSDE